MVSITQKSRSCVLLLLLLTQSIFPPLPLLFFTVITTSVCPAFALAAQRTPKTTILTIGDINKSTIFLPAAISTTFTNSVFKRSSTTTQSSNYFSLAAFTPSSSSKSSVTSSPAASIKALSRQFAERAALKPNSVHCPLRPLNQISRLLPHPCKHLTLSFNTIASPHRNLPPPLAKMSLYLPAKRPRSTLSPKGLQYFDSANKLPSPVLSKTSPSPSEQTSFHHPRPPRRRSLPQTTGPLFEHQPFIVSWNIPDLVCNRYNISLDTSSFKGVATPAKVPGQFLSLFYTDRLGLYPHVDLVRRKQFYGGIPQRGNLKASMNKARADINYYIPSKTSRGLAVIDWEEWRPLWDRNWGNKRIYQTLSVAHVVQKNRSLTLQEATEKAKHQFELAARSLMAGMLAMGRAMRPNYLWGFYLFPNCYNYGWLEPGYTGRCSKEVRRQNDELLWLWESSTALYPSVYLQASLADNPQAALMVRNRVQEALRVSTLPRRSSTAPVFVYTRPVFVDQNRRFLSQGDLVSTLGESAAVGASGAVLWGASADYDDQASCKSLSSYLSSTLNPYVTNVTAAAQLCSNFLCRGNGRCVRKNYNSNHYLHLNPVNFKIVHIQKRYFVIGRPTFTDLRTLSRRFTCQCYKGLNCTPRTNSELAKALLFSVKQGLHQKSHILNKVVLDDKQQASITKDNVEKNFKD